MLKVKDVGRPPKGMQWKYTNPEDGYELSALHFDVLKGKVKKYRVNNNYPIGSDFENQFQINICGNADPNDCEDSEPPTLAKRLLTFANAMSQFAKSGFKLASPELVDERLNICQGCQHFSGIHSVFKVGCTRCGCSSKKANVFTEACPLGKW